MLRQFLENLQKSGKLESFFYSGQVGVGIVFAIFIWLLRPKAPESGFRVREVDLRKAKPRRPSQSLDPLAEARIGQQTLSLPGISLTGEPHEVLGVSRHATPEQIQVAYRELMKRYHPDQVGRPGSREWSDAQKIAVSLNRAKDALLKK
jgi:DnaJ-domain-containing protein 1